MFVFCFVVFGGAFLVKQVRADETETIRRGGIGGPIAEKFGLDQQEVDQAIDQFRQEHRVEMRLDWEDRFSQAVEDGVITDDQLQALIEKKEEVMANRTRMRDEMHAWMEENGIDVGALGGYGCGEKTGTRTGFKMGLRQM